MHFRPWHFEEHVIIFVIDFFMFNLKIAVLMFFNILRYDFNYI